MKSKKADGSGFSVQRFKGWQIRASDFFYFETVRRGYLQGAVPDGDHSAALNPEPLNLGTLDLYNPEP
jgi:hypothetical protein